MEIKGLNSLNAKLTEIAALQLTEALVKGALRVERDAKILVPVDTGTLRNSITHTIDGNVATVGTSIEYAANVELGLGQRAQPYLEPALMLNKERIQQDFVEEINKQLRGIANG